MNNGFGPQISPPRRNLPPEHEADDNQHEDHNDQSDAGDDTGPDVHEGAGTAATVVRGDPTLDSATAAATRPAHSVDARHLLGRRAASLADRLDLEYREGLKKRTYRYAEKGKG